MKNSMKSVLLGLVLLGSAATLADEGAKYWGAWRGPLGTGMAPHGNPPIEWGEGKNVRWKVELPGPGHASPVVWGDRVYVLSAVQTREAPGVPRPDETPKPGAGEGSAQAERPGRRGPSRAEQPTTIHEFVVTALDRKSGETIWNTTVRKEIPHEPGHLTASQASASPVTDGQRIYAFFGSRGLYCLDLDGKVEWEIDLGDMRTRNEFGEGASPALHGDTLIVNWDHEDQSFIVALDKQTGKQRWKVLRDEPTSWATPVVVEDGDRSLVVATGTNRVRAYDLKSGEPVWECGGLGVNCIPTPIVEEGLLFVMSGYREAAGMAIRYAGATGDITGSDRIAWRLTRGLSYVPSPLLHEGKLYFLEQFRGVLSNVDLKTGEVYYTEQRLEGIGNIYASLVGAGDRFYLIDRDGNGLTIGTGPKFEILGRSKLDDLFDASPAIAGDALYIRGHRHLYSIAAP